MSEADVMRLEVRMRAKGRIRRERWTEQAQALAQARA